MTIWESFADMQNVWETRKTDCESDEDDRREQTATQRPNVTNIKMILSLIAEKGEGLLGVKGIRVKLSNANFPSPHFIPYNNTTTTYPHTHISTSTQGTHYYLGTTTAAAQPYHPVMITMEEDLPFSY